MPSFLFDGAAFHVNGLRQFVNWGSFFFKGALRFFSRTLPSSLTLKGGSTALPKPLSPQGRGDVNRSYSSLGTAALQGRRGIKALVWIFCRLALCEQVGKVILKGIEGRDVVGLDDAEEVLLVDSDDGGHFCPKGVDLSVVDGEPV